MISLFRKFNDICKVLVSLWSLWYTILIYKNLLYFYSSKQSESEIKIVPFKIILKNEILSGKSCNRCANLYVENYKTLLRKLKI